jgi:hypothetical protein
MLICVCFCFDLILILCDLRCLIPFCVCLLSGELAACAGKKKFIARLLCGGGKRKGRDV